MPEKEATGKELSSYEFFQYSLDSLCAQRKLHTRVPVDPKMCARIIHDKMPHSFIGKIYVTFSQLEFFPRRRGVWGIGVGKADDVPGNKEYDAGIVGVRFSRRSTPSIKRIQDAFMWDKMDKFFLLYGKRNGTLLYGKRIDTFLCGKTTETLLPGTNDISKKIYDLLEERTGEQHQQILTRRHSRYLADAVYRTIFRD